MKQILLVFDGEHFSHSILNFSLQLHLQSPLTLTGIFLPSKDFVESLSYFYYGNAIAPVYLQEYEEDPKKIEANIMHFQSFCNNHNIPFKIHRKNFHQHISSGIQEETRFADLLLISSTKFYENLGTTLQEQYLREALRKSECPILLLPENYTPPAINIIAYDGSSSAMHALKQFVYILPHLTELDTHIIYSDKHQNGIPNEELIKNYTAGYFRNLSFYDLDFDFKKYFTTWLEDEKPSIVVCGSFGRNALSELIHRNFLLDVMREHKLPIFIAHH